MAASASCDVVGSRVSPFSAPDRHHHLLTVDARDGSIVAAGFADAPMTHSADGGRFDQRMFGSLVLALR